MDKSMYSLMLMDSIVREIDRQAFEQGTNRSSLINHILAEYLQMKTPEMRIKEIFDLMTEQLNSLAGFKVQSLPSDFCIAVKSPLEYKYRPTIKYSVEIYRAPGEAAGELRVVFRTQHDALLARLAAFFELWINMETYYLQKLLRNAPIRYSVEEGRFRRTFMLPAEGEEVTSGAFSKAITDYIGMFDDILKFYLYNMQAGVEDVEKKYLEYLNSGMLFI
ncbi:MAG: hypothetical protein FWF44_04790 [Defluviitaleaceae bacterium]|nr:hypothetical protein [Defluviitaleaceae bacterium]